MLQPISVTHPQVYSLGGAQNPQLVCEFEIGSPVARDSPTRKGNFLAFSISLFSQGALEQIIAEARYGLALLF
jgi:hypothetical protein